MARWPGAIWQPVAQCSGTLRPIAVCLHHQAGWGNPAAVYASRMSRPISGCPKPGIPVQHVDTGVRAWHGGGTLNDTSIGVETEGCGNPPHADPLTEHQLVQFGALMAWANQVHGVPLVLSETATTPGLNYHRCQGGFNTACPCDVRVNMRSEILRRAGGGAPAALPLESEDNMVLGDKVTGGVWIAYRDGAVHTLGDAPHLGGTNNATSGAAGHPCIGIYAYGDGYALVHEFGSGVAPDRDPRAITFRADRV